VVISVKNRSEMLWDCFQGLAAQGYPKDRFEVVLIDNCSSEDLNPVVDRARRELGLSFQTRRTDVDKGPAPARNLGVSMARGEIIAFTDSDCRPTPGWIALGAAEFARAEVALVSGPVLPKPEQTATLTSKLSFVTPTEHPTFPTANLFVRKSVFEAHHGFDVTLSFRDPFDRATECADTDLAWRIIKAGHERRFLPDAVMLHEIERQGVWFWMLEGTRLFLVPELVRRHPELRSQLLTANLFFYPPALLIYVGIAVIIAAALVQPWLLAALPVLLLARGVQRTRSVNPMALLRFCGRTLLHLPRMLVMSLALIYGSIRFRSLVL
jgi:glycosyltransferase involved in cell wall biosynthesis